MSDFQRKLIEHRRSIDRLDTILIYTLGERFKHTENIGKLKAEANLQVSDHGREQFQIERLRKLAIDANLDSEFAERLLKFIISEVIENHKKWQTG
ncbi:MAG: chorismate mutase [Paracoccaceae bacterium]